MLNIHELERRWIKYKIKTYIPALLLTIGGTTVITLGLLYFPQQEGQSKKSITDAKVPVEKTVINSTVPDEISIDVPDNTQIKVISTKQNSLILKPSLHFMDNIENGLSSYVQDDYISPQTQVNPSPDRWQNNENSFSLDDTEPQASQAIQDEKKLTLSITTEKNDSDLKDVIRRFKKNKNPALSLFIAKHYYDKANYQKSYNYALMTNQIDKNIDASWIIFSKSLVKLGQQELAMNTLKSYLKTSKSSAAKVLLRKIQSGNFK